MRFLPLLAFIATAAASPGTAASASGLLEASAIKGGIIVQVGCGDGHLLAALHANDRFLVQGLDRDSAAVEKARGSIRELGLYGTVSVDTFDGMHLPYVGNLVNLIVMADTGAVSLDEILRVLVPNGVALVRADSGPEPNARIEEAASSRIEIAGRRWLKIVKPWPSEIDEWTHFLHGPDNNAVAQDRKVDIPRSIQWVSKPRWGRSHEELASLSAAVTAEGRLYYIVDKAPLASIRFASKWNLVARDAFNGTRLWTRPIPSWTDQLRHFRSGPAHLPRRLVAVGDKVYLTSGIAGPVVQLDGATGKVLRQYKGTERTEEIIFSESVLYLVVGTSEVIRHGAGLHARGEPAPTNFRYIAAVDANSGKRLWKRDLTKDNILPLTLAVKGSRVYFQSTRAVVCLEAKSGKEVWAAPRPTPARRMGWSAPTLVATDEVILSADRDIGKSEQGLPSAGTIEWGVSGWNEKGFARKSSCTLRAYATTNGKEIWSVKCAEGYNSPVDVFVINGIVWVGKSFKGFDLKTGSPAGHIKTKAPRVGMPHHRCYRDKASVRFIFTGKSGIEVLSLDKGWLSNNSWIRGTCQYGIIPANGMLYAPPDACACFLSVKAPGLFVAAPRRHKTGKMPFPAKPVIQKGTAYGSKLNALVAGENDWPMYRHDPPRSGAVSSAIPDSPCELWSVSVGGKLTQPAIAGGKVFVASCDTHTVHAFSTDAGRKLWHFTAGGRIDSTPTFFNGKILFGSADGWVYCLRAADGALIWRFRAAPQDRRVGVYGQLESIWPVPGAVLVLNGILFVTAGRSSYLDGGIVLYRIDSATGRELSKTVLCQLDPETGAQLVPEAKFNMEGTTSDILSADEDLVFLKYFCFDLDGKRTHRSRPHLFSITGMLGEEWFVRSYWTFGEGMPGAGWSFWTRAASQFPAGRILCFSRDRLFGYGRTRIVGGAAGHRADASHLYAVSLAKNAMQTDRKGKKRSAKSKPIWTDSGSILARAMVLGTDRLAVAGVIDLAKRDPNVLAFKNEQEALAGFEGRKGAALRIVRTADGMRMSEWKLEAMPVFDGMAAARGRLFLALKDGSLLCLGPGNGKPLPGSAVPTPPVADAAEPEPPQPGPVPKLTGPSKRDDFSTVTADKIVASELGYTLASEKKQLAFALKKLDSPLKGKATFKLQLRPTPGFSFPRFFENGFVAFGDGEKDADLVKCGIKFVQKSAVILLGSTRGAATKSQKLQFRKSKPVEIEVSVDLENKKVVLKAGGQTLEARLDRPLNSITHLGYSTINAVTDFGQIQTLQQ